MQAVYSDDSFFSLTPPGQVGLAALSLALFALTLLFFRKSARKLPWIIRIPYALAIFYAFNWLSPQIYYFYYLTQFSGLPIQNVIHPPTGVGEIVRLITFQEEATMSAHSRGILAWALIALAIWRR